MISEQFLSFVPKLKPYTVIPSEDHPAEFVIICQDNGAALGITNQEKRILQLCDGASNLAAIIQQTVHEQIAPLTALRQLIWDLDRFGFLQSSPWHDEGTIDGWGYWGTRIDSGDIAIIPTLSKSIEMFLGRMFRSPWFSAAALIVFVFSFISHYSIFHDIQPFIIQGSAALGALVVFGALAAGYLVATWLEAMILRTIHPSPVRCLIDYTHTFPVLRLDGRRLRALTTKQALHTAVLQAVIVVFISSLALLSAQFADDSWKEWIYHLAFTHWILAVFLVVPWTSNLLSREIQLRLRRESVFKTMTQSVRDLFQFFYKHPTTIEIHKTLYFGWGIWSIASSLLVSTGVLVSIRYKLPGLTGHFIVEDNPLIVIPLILVLGIVSAVIVTGCLSLVAWLAHSLIDEIQGRYWPACNSAIVLLGLLTSIPSIAVWYFSCGPLSYSAVSITLICSGSALLLFNGSLCRFLKVGVEPMLWWIPAAFGLLLLAHGIAQIIWPVNVYPPQLSEPAGYDWWREPSPVLLLYTTFYHGLTALLAVWLFWLYGVRFAPVVPRPLRQTKLTIQMACVFGASILMGYWLPFPESIQGTYGRLIVGILLMSLAGIFWTGLSINGSVPLLTGGCAIMYAGILWTTERYAPGLGIYGVPLGVVFVLLSFALRRAAIDKTVLGISMNMQQPIPPGEWTPSHSIHEFNLAAIEMFGARPAITVDSESDPDPLRTYLAQLVRLVGKPQCEVLFRRFSQAAPWREAQSIKDRLPKKFALPMFEDWNEIRIGQMLAKVPSFSGMPETIEQMVPRVRYAWYRGGDAIVRDQPLEGRLYIVADGKLIVRLAKPFGQSIVTTLSNGDFFGEIGFITGTEKAVTVQAIDDTLVLILNRCDAKEADPSTFPVFREAEQGKTWIQSFSNTVIFNEFPYPLIARLYLASKAIELNRNETLWLGSNEYAHSIAVYLSGKGSMIEEGQIEPLNEGALIGLEACMTGRAMSGKIRAEEPSRVVLIDRSIVLNTITELLTPHDTYRLKSSKKWTDRSEYESDEQHPAPA